jgi:hypothetical protein
MAQYNQSHADSASLVCRPLKADEWHDTYLVDVVQDHGIKRPSANDVNWIRSRTKTTKTTALRDPCQVRLVYSGYPLYADVPAPDWGAYSRFGPTRYCPHCLIEDGYFRARWRLNGYQICSRHRCFIKRDLQLFLVPNGYTLKSGKTLSQMSEAELLGGAKYCTPDELMIHQAVWGDFEQLVCGASPTAIESEKIGSQAAWSILTWSLIDRVARINCSRLSRRTFVGPVEGIAEYFQSKNLTVLASRSGVLAFFQDLKEHPTYAGGMRHIQRIDRFERQRPSLVSKTNLEQLLQTILAARPEIGIRPTVGTKCFVRDDQRGMSVHQLSKVLGVSGVTAGKWARLGLIRTEDRSNVPHSRLRFVPPAEVRALLLLRRSLLTREEFCELHALDVDTGHMLYNGGALQTIDYARCRYITKESASNLMLRLELQCAPLDEQEPKLKWPLFGLEVKTAACQNSERMSLLNAAAAGEVRLFRSLNRPGLSSFFVGVDAMAWLRRRVRHLRTKHLRFAAESAAGGNNLFQDH